MSREDELSELLTEMINRRITAEQAIVKILKKEEENGIQRITLSLLFLAKLIDEINYES